MVMSPMIAASPSPNNPRFHRLPTKSITLHASEGRVVQEQPQTTLNSLNREVGVLGTKMDAIMPAITRIDSATTGLVTRIGHLEELALTEDEKDWVTDCYKESMANTQVTLDRRALINWVSVASLVVSFAVLAVMIYTLSR